MMISPTSYAENFEKADYLELMEERDRLFAFIKDYVVQEIDGDRSGEE